jgi:hypothetical protein
VRLSIERTAARLRQAAAYSTSAEQQSKPTTVGKQAFGRQAVGNMPDGKQAGFAGRQEREPASLRSQQAFAGGRTATAGSRDEQVRSFFLADEVNLLPVAFCRRPPASGAKPV